MDYLALALFAEGAKDHRFLSPLLRRLAEDICLVHGNRIIEVGPVIGLSTPRGFEDQDRSNRILEAARRADDAFHILVVHADGAGDPEQARAERVEPAIAAISAELRNGEHRAIGVVPVRETEAWALADGDSLRQAFGTSLTNAALGVPERPGEVEGILDPKLCLEHAYAAVIGGRRRRRRSASDFLELLGEKVRLGEVDRVPSFARLRAELHGKLRQLGFARH